MRFSLDYEQRVRIVEWRCVPNVKCLTIFSCFYYRLQVGNKPIVSDVFTSVSVLLQLMAVGNQAGKTFVWDISVDDPTKARYSFL